MLFHRNIESFGMSCGTVTASPLISTTHPYIPTSPANFLRL